MPRKKKDGRFINYYIDRHIFERLEGYAQARGQQMTTAIERILQEHLDRHESLLPKSSILYCPECNQLTVGPACSGCGSRELRLPRGEDLCRLAETDIQWKDMLCDLLTRNRIPFITKNVLAAKLGTALERIRFYVPYSYLETAKQLQRLFFPALRVE